MFGKNEINWQWETQQIHDSMKYKTSVKRRLGFFFSKLILNTANNQKRLPNTVK